MESWGLTFGGRAHDAGDKFPSLRSIFTPIGDGPAIAPQTDVIRCGNRSKRIEFARLKVMDGDRGRNIDELNQTLLSNPSDPIRQYT